jgi:hypothetical protein
MLETRDLASDREKNADLITTMSGELESIIDASFTRLP